MSLSHEQTAENENRALNQMASAIAALSGFAFIGGMQILFWGWLGVLIDISAVALAAVAALALKHSNRQPWRNIPLVWLTGFILLMVTLQAAHIAIGGLAVWATMQAFASQPFVALLLAVFVFAPLWLAGGACLVAAWFARDLAEIGR